jgi:deazaflavin-dependent oxidoreductase (nitroreductase family)
MVGVVSSNVDHLTFVERVFLLPLLRMHHLIYQATGGRLGHRRMPGMPPCLLLHTIGARTGNVRASTLVYARDERDYLVVASFGGAPKAPAWLHNLRRNPHAEINVGASRMRVAARAVVPGDSDYPRAWRVVNQNSSNEFERLQRRTTRPIAVVILSPI